MSGIISERWEWCSESAEAAVFLETYDSGPNGMPVSLKRLMFQA